MINYVDPFYGSEARSLPEPEGLAANWFYIKAQIGNTHPGASLPHDPVSALPYSGGYPTGYGLYLPNYCGPPKRMHRRKVLYGISHVQQTGTGSIGFYYNFLLTRPFLGSPAIPPVAISQARPAEMHDEIAVPGYYSCKVREWNTEIQLTAADHAVFHRYTPLSSGSLKESRGVIVDITQGGLGLTKRISRPESVKMERKGNVVQGSFSHYGVLWHFALVPDESALMSSPELWKREASGEGELKPANDGWIPVESLKDEFLLQLNESELKTHRAGCLWLCKGDQPMDICIGLSQDSVEQACNYASRALHKGYKDQCAETEARWDQHFEKIETEGGSEDRKKLFYSSWFHASRKPVRGENNNFLWNEGPELWSDVATMWDQYKTLIPFLATFYPEKALSLARSLYKTGEVLDRFPAAVITSSNQKTFERQSRNLAVLIICEIFHHSRFRDLASDSEWIAMLPLLVKEVKREYEGIEPRDMVNSHRLDIAYAAHCLAAMADTLGEHQYSDELEEIAASWSESFDDTTGYMKEGGYYEGDHVHYSFRLLHSMKERINLCGGEKRFEEMLDQYFGYGAPPVKQIGSGMSQKKGMALNRFDGLNNEVMMETPFAYHFIGCPDKTNEIVHGIQNYHFHPNPGGLAGNDDSGAMTSWYVWNAIGLFPMAGSGLFFISLPLFDKAEIRSCGFRIHRFQNIRKGEKAVYFEKLLLNEIELDRTYLQLDEVLSGGVLEIHLTDRPGCFEPARVPLSTGVSNPK